jgi:holo-[acyl-carrier protein] synthase
MIVGIGTDIVEVARMERLWQRHRERAMGHVLAPEEFAVCEAAAHRGRFLAKRFAAKEALAKALGTGLRAPLVLPAIRVVHDALGKPDFVLSESAASMLAGRRAHLSISDERDFVVAFVVVESLDEQ